MTACTPLVAAHALDGPVATIAAQPACDNLLGLCDAIGTGLGVNPLWLRIAFAGAVLADFEAALIAYLAAAALVALARRRPASTEGVAGAGAASL